MYAGHCGQQTRVQFGSPSEGFTIEIDPASCVVDPLWTEPGNDIAYCQLPFPVDIPIVHMLGTPEPLPNVGDPVVLVGYGDTETGDSFDTKHAGTAPYVGRDGDEILVGGNGVDTCDGDSGGPAMYEMPDGTWRVIGFTSRTLPDENPEGCGGITRYTYAPASARWAEMSLAIDITPCFDGSVPMMCEISDPDPDLEAPLWCEWLTTSALDETGGTGETSAGGMSEESGGSNDSLEEYGTDTFDEETPVHRGCSCATADSSESYAMALVLGFVCARTAYRMARMTSSYESE